MNSCIDNFVFYLGGDFFNEVVDVCVNNKGEIFFIL